MIYHGFEITRRVSATVVERVDSSSADVLMLGRLLFGRDESCPDRMKTMQPIPLATLNRSRWRFFATLCVCTAASCMTACEPIPCVPAGPVRNVTERLIARIDIPFSLLNPNPWYPPFSLITSPDCRRVAYVIRQDGRWAVVLDGKADTPYRHIMKGSLLFSPDSLRFAYAADMGDYVATVVDGKEGTRYRKISSVTFSPDGRHFAYVADTGTSTFCVVDGREGTGYDNVTSVSFAPDSRRLIFVARSGDRERLVADGSEGAAYDFIEGVAMSPDGRRVALVEGMGKRMAPPAPRFRLTPHPLAYASGVDQSKRRAVIDGAPGKVYDDMDTPVFSPDGRRVAYKANLGKQWFVVIDGREQPPFDALGAGPVVFSPDSRRTAYVARSGARWTAVIDGIGHEHDDITNDPVFSPDSKHVAYVARDGRRASAVIDGHPGPPHRAINRAFLIPAMRPVALTFSPDSRHTAYWAPSAQVGGSYVAVDNLAGASRGQILGSITFSSNRHLRFLELRSEGMTATEVYAVDEAIP